MKHNFTIFLVRHNEVISLFWALTTEISIFQKSLIDIELTDSLSQAANLAHYFLPDGSIHLAGTSGNSHLEQQILMNCAIGTCTACKWMPEQHLWSLAWGESCKLIGSSWDWRTSYCAPSFLHIPTPHYRELTLNSRIFPQIRIIMPVVTLFHEWFLLDAVSYATEFSQFLYRNCILAMQLINFRFDFYALLECILKYSRFDAFFT
jgi:hypothetical protein